MCMQLFIYLVLQETCIPLRTFPILQCIYTCMFMENSLSQILCLFKITLGLLNKPLTLKNKRFDVHNLYLFCTRSIRVGRLFLAADIFLTHKKGINIYSFSPYFFSSVGKKMKRMKEITSEIEIKGTLRPLPPLAKNFYLEFS